MGFEGNKKYFMKICINAHALYDGMFATKLLIYSVRMERA